MPCSRRAAACAGGDDELDRRGRPTRRATTTSRSRPREAAAGVHRAGPVPGRASRRSSSPAARRSRCGTRRRGTRRRGHLRRARLRCRRRSGRCSPPTSRPSYTFDGGRDCRVGRRRVPARAVQPRVHRHPAAVSFLTSHLASLGHGRGRARPPEPRSDARARGHRRAGDRRAATGGRPARDARPDRRPRARRRTAAFDGPRRHRRRSRPLGHSAGGGTVLGAAADDGVAGYVSLASGPGGRRRRRRAAVPDTAELLRGRGARRRGAAPDTVTPAAFEAAPPRRGRGRSTAAGHNGFDDFCTFGDGTGIIGIAEASGLGRLPRRPAAVPGAGRGRLRPAGRAGREAFPVIRHGVTAWLRQALGIDDEPVGLGPDVAESSCRCRSRSRSRTERRTVLLT